MFKNVLFIENGQCGGVITDESGTISSTDVDNNGQYDADKDCLWTLMAPEGQFVELNMLTFNLQPSSTCALDFLQVHVHVNSRDPFVTLWHIP